ncbi:MAG: hypothetical protein QXS20_05465 [Candidatus Thorarchaeota archaeon]
MSKWFGLAVTSLFVVLSAFSTYVLWTLVGWRIGVQVLVTLIIAGVGEHHVSGRGYYHYTSINGIFVGRVPVWIPFMWVFACHFFHLLSLAVGLTGHWIVIGTGMLGMLTDLSLVEPLFSRVKGLWLWTPVERGYFSFIPSQFNRFTAPPGNYIVWFGFPALMCLLLMALQLL